MPTHVWTDHEYLTEVLMYLLYSAAGAAALSLSFGLVTWLAFVLIHRTSASARPPFVVAGLFLTLAGIAGSPIWGPRAQMITFFFTALELYWLAGYLAGRSRSIKWFPLVMVLWANLHGGWVVGFAFLGVAFSAELIRWAATGSPEARAHVRRLAVIGLLALAAVIATPHGLGLYLYPFETQGSSAQQRLIVEWFSPDFHQGQLRAFEAMILLLFGGFAIRRPSLYHLLLSLVVLVLALQSVRHTALFVAAATPILVETYSGAWRIVAARYKLRLSQVSPTPLLAGVTVAVLVLIAGVTALRVGEELGRQRAVDRSTFPAEAADWLAANPEVGTRMYNQYGWGGYLAYRFYPEPNRRVFIFGEAALMGDGLLNRYQDVQTLRTNWNRVLDENRVDYVVYNRDEALSNVLITEPDRWKLVHQDKVAMVFVRVGSGGPG